MAQTRWLFETGADGNAGSASNHGASSVTTSGGTLTLTDDTPTISGLSSRMVGTASSGGCYLATSGLSTNAAALDMYLTLETAPSTIVAIMSVQMGSTRCVSIEMLTNRTLRLMDRDYTSRATTPAIPLTDTLVRVALYTTRDPSAGTMRLAVWTGASPATMTLLSDSDLLTGYNTGESAWTGWRVGIKTGTGTQTGTLRLLSWAGDPDATGLPTPYSSNAVPVADAGPDQTAEAGATVTLTGSGTDSDGTITSYAWAQTTGPTVTLDGSGATRTFTAPVTLTGATLGFQLTVTDDDAATDTDTMTVTVLPATIRLRIGGETLPAIRRTTT